MAEPSTSAPDKAASPLAGLGPSDLVAKFNAIAAESGGIDDGDSPDDGDEETTPPAAAKPAEVGKPAKGKAALAAAAETEDAPEDAEKPDHELTAREHAAIRQERRRVKAKERELADVKARLEHDFAQRAAQLEATSPGKLRALVDSGEFDALAKLMGCNDWNDLNVVAAKALNDPGYRERQRITREHEQLKADLAAERKQAADAAAEARRQAAERNYVSGMKSEMAASADPITKAFSEDPKFLQMVWNMRREHYLATEEELPLAECVNETVKVVRATYSHLHKILGVQPTAEQAEAAVASAIAATPDRAGSRKPPARHVPRSRAVESGSAGSLSREQLLKAAAEQWKQDVDSDIAAGKF